MGRKEENEERKDGLLTVKARVVIPKHVLSEEDELAKNVFASEYVIRSASHLIKRARMVRVCVYQL